ncbi:MAG: UDP-N-acetylmuramoyl-tripeptide--D-alanyl-D-alanine ligase [Steroidobacteraceae bacterium]
MKRTLADAATATGGTLHGADRPFTGVSSDTRQLQPGELFVALRGPRFDGNQFVAAAAAAGAAGAIVDARQNLDLPQIVVKDGLAALTALAQRWRAQFQIPIVGVAGSNGKTTVKEMTAAILASAGACLATQGNLNNHIGVPLTLMRLLPEHRYAVIEMGANRAGDVAELVTIAQPTVGLITNAGAEHLEGFGSLEGVARAEGEMVAGLAAAATAVLNADDPFADLWRSMTAASVVSFGLDAYADYTAHELRTSVDASGFKTRFTLRSPAGSAPIELALAGRHNVLNALCAAAAAMSAGAGIVDVVAGLASMRAVAGRLQFRTAPSGALLLDDSYNANPSSVRAGIDVLAGIEARKWLVIGDMAELGEFTAASHADVGAYARERGIERLFAVGKSTPLAVEAFGAGGQWFADSDALVRSIGGSLTSDVCVLIKGSRVNRLERVVEALAAGDPARKAG